MKKYLAAAALVGLIGISGISMASPQGYYGYGNCGGSRYCDNYSQRDDGKTAAFLEETRELRKQLTVKNSELDALMRQDNPDEKKVATLTGEIYDLQAAMDEKADKAFAGSDGDDYAPGPGYGYCGRGRRVW